MTARFRTLLLVAFGLLGLVVRSLGGEEKPAPFPNPLFPTVGGITEKELQRLAEGNTAHIRPETLAGYIALLEAYARYVHLQGHPQGRAAEGYVRMAIDRLRGLEEDERWREKLPKDPAARVAFLEQALARLRPRCPDPKDPLILRIENELARIRKAQAENPPKP
jgi:hypothetical protein